MAEQTPEQQFASKVDSLRYKISDLQSKVRLSSIRDEIEDIDSKINNLKQNIRDLRTNGYLFGKELETKATALQQRWPAIRLSIIPRLDEYVRELERPLREIEARFTNLPRSTSSSFANERLLTELTTAAETLENRAGAVENDLRGMYNAFTGELQQMKSDVERIEWALKQLAEASFTLLPTEGLVMAVKATWLRDDKEDKDDPKGILFLTDQRLIFEQKQEIATKKILFITTEKQKVQKLMVEVPVAKVSLAKGSKQGFLGHEDHLECQFQESAPFRSTRFHLDGQDSADWQQLVGRVKAGDLDNERVVPVSDTVMEQVKAAPTECPSCGAPITAQVLRGMTSITCDSCGRIIRL